MVVAHKLARARPELQDSHGDQSNGTGRADGRADGINRRRADASKTGDGRLGISTRQKQTAEALRVETKTRAEQREREKEQLNRQWVWASITQGPVQLQVAGGLVGI